MTDPFFRTRTAHLFAPVETTKDTGCCAVQTGALRAKPIPTPKPTDSAEGKIETRVTNGATKVVSLFHSRVTAPQTSVGDVGSVMRGNCQYTHSGSECW